MNMTTNATFVNHSSSLSSLSSSLCSYARLLDVSDDPIRATTGAEDRASAQEFLENVSRRAGAVDDALLKATEDILPPAPEMKTATELAELCRLVQESTRHKISILKTRLELVGAPKTWDSITSPAPMKRLPSQHHQHQQKSHPQIQWSVGAPLDCVIEGDVETEGATTPGSMLYPSPFSSATKKTSKVLTPTTPTLDALSLSANTNNILENMKLDKPSSAVKTRRSSTRGSRASVSPATTRNYLRSPIDHQINFDGFKEEDDMITLATAESQSTFTDSKLKKGATSPSLQRKEARSQFLARMESLLERVEENLNHENRPSDEISHLSITSGIEPKSSRPSNSRFLEEVKEENEDEETDFDDDSTNVVATQVASVGSKLKTSKPKEVPVSITGDSISFDRGDLPKPIPVVKRPTQIIVDTNMPSPARTNITMDNTMMNDTMISMSMVQYDDVNDNDSTVTPVLDRYRLDPDDTSIGIRVVPNMRGTRGGSMHPLITETVDEARTPVAPLYMEDTDGFVSPRGVPGSVSERKQKKYRKTPFPKKQNNSSTLSEDDENDHPNTRLTFSDDDSVSQSVGSHSTGTSFSVPPLRPRSMGPTRKSSRAAKSTARAMSLPAHNSLPRTPNQTDASFESKFSSQSHSSTDKNKLLEKITHAEYEMAPQVVTMQVSHKEANQVLHTIEDYLVHAKGSESPLEFTEDEAYQILSSSVSSNAKAKTILMSLCHWRRLLMYRNEDRGMLFAVNQF